MATLITTISIKEDTDYDGNPTTWKEASSTIDDLDTGVKKSYPETDTDPVITIDYEAYLTSLGFTWDN